MKDNEKGLYAPQHRLADLREWLLDRIDGSEETRGDDGLISDFIRQIDALPSETTPIPQSKTQARRFAAQMEPRGCPTPGACSCPGTIPDAERKKVMTAHMLAESIVERATVETPRTDGIVFKAQPGMMPPYDTVPAEFSRTLERELIDLKQRILPQYLGRAERAERDRDAAQVAAIAAEGDAAFAEHERDALLEQLIAARKTINQIKLEWEPPPSATGAPVAWMYTEDGERMFGHPDGYRPKDAVPLYAAPVEVTAMPYANLGDILMQYVDRLSDPVDTDPLEKIVAELLAALDGRDMKGEQP